MTCCLLVIELIHDTFELVRGNAFVEPTPTRFGDREAPRRLAEPPPAQPHFRGVLMYASAARKKLSLLLCLLVGTSGSRGAPKSKRSFMTNARTPAARTTSASTTHGPGLAFFRRLWTRHRDLARLGRRIFLGRDVLAAARTGETVAGTCVTGFRTLTRISGGIHPLRGPCTTLSY